MNRINLNGEWLVEGTAPDGGKIEFLGTVPGSALNDLLKFEGKGSVDIFYRDNAEQYQKYENYDWTYTKKFNMDSVSGKINLVFEKLDTYCDLYLNSVHLGYCENNFIDYTFDVSDVLFEGENNLEVRFYSPIAAVRGKVQRDAAFTAERMNTRRIQCTYGWDWTMRFVTCGISQDVCLERIDTGIKVSDAYIYTKSIDEESAQIGIDIDFEDFKSGGTVDFEIYSPEGELVAKRSKYYEEEFMRMSFDVAEPELWYPAGYGEQPLYRIVIRCGDRVLFEETFGIRTIKVMQISDNEGSEFYNKCLEIKKAERSHEFDKNTEFSGFILKINGKKIMCKGGNWVPCEPYAQGSTDQKITKILTLAKDMGVNMIRVWGGGDFETDHFYNECSRLGIMVTQDFLMACATYPEKEQWFLNHLKKEAEFAAKKLRNKTCLVWWSGDNENACKGCDTDEDYTGRNSAFKAIAPVIYKRDPYREFFPSSPYGGNLYASVTAGTSHNTNFLSHWLRYIDNSDMKDYKDKYKEFRARFIAEEPSMGVCSLPSLKKFMSDEDIYGDDKKMWLYHTKTNPCMKELFDYMSDMAQKILGGFEDPNDRLFKYKYIQYEWVRFCVEQVRREKWFSSGIVFWMLNDCWPAAGGWSFIDYYCQPKASYYSFKRAAKPVIASIDRENKEYKLYICNDSNAQMVKCRAIKLSKNLKDFTILLEDEVNIAENTSGDAFKISADEIKSDETLIFEVTDNVGNTDRAFYKQGDLNIEDCTSELEVVKTCDTQITVKSKSYIHAVEFEAESVFSDNYFSLLPGEEKIVEFEKCGNGDIDIKAYTIKI